jgi:hypothetical protein
MDRDVNDKRAGKRSDNDRVPGRNSRSDARSEEKNSFRPTADLVFTYWKTRKTKQTLYHGTAI